MKVVTSREIHDDFALLAEISDEQLKELEQDPFKTRDMAFMGHMVASKGDNAHIIMLHLKKLYRINLYADQLLSQFKTVSWVHKGKLYIRSRE
jgi:hypothetical protein